MNTAMQLLKSGNYTVSEVCYKVGASSLANFSRSFKRQFGIPPSEVQ
ncbi:helix-turn-helix domain-containing protein [Phocaeicola barnesiae]